MQILMCQAAENVKDRTHIDTFRPAAHMRNCSLQEPPNTLHLLPGACVPVQQLQISRVAHDNG